MLTEEKLVNKLQMTAEDFRAAVYAKNFLRAKALYNNALAVSVYVELDPAVRSELFGQHGGLEEDEESPKGLFPRWMVEQVDLECCIKRHKAYEDRTCRILGQSVKYYSDEDFCARCGQKKDRPP
jgi:hypothetical protein